MADAIILEFDGVNRNDYEAVNEKLGFDLERGTGVPDGLLFHAGTVKPGGMVTFEVWESKEAQERFLTERLQPALRAAGVTAPPTRADWLDIAAYASLGS